MQELARLTGDGDVREGSVSRGLRSQHGVDQDADDVAAGGQHNDYVPVYSGDLPNEFLGMTG